MSQKCVICDGYFPQEPYSRPKEDIQNMLPSEDDPEICNGCMWNMMYEPKAIKAIIVGLREELQGYVDAYERS